MSSSGADPPPQPHPHDSHSSSSSAGGPPSSSRPAPDSRHDPFPFSLRRPFQANPSSTTLVPSTAEGKPIPVDDSTAEHRTSALRELNHNYPSRHRYAKSTGAQSSTYSEPVIVRSYYSPGPSRPVSKTRAGVVVHNGASPATVAASESGGPSGGVRRVLPFISTVAPAGNGMLSSMARARAKKLLSASAPEDPRLPPVEAFSFKSFMANMESQDAGDINADLDRIAEICARSRYSLSNQYEVHYQPHGSGSAFLAEARNQDSHGPTLQVVSSDDERNLKRQRKRRGGARRNSRAMGTLETIMSSSRSSDEDKTKKKSAAEIAQEVRGRAARKDSGDTSPATSSHGTLESQLSQDEHSPSKTGSGRRSAASLALIEGSRQHPTSGDASSPRTSATALVGQPALPQASTSQLEIRTAPEPPREQENYISQPKRSNDFSDVQDTAVAKGAISPMEERNLGGNLFSALSNWVPWRPADGLGRSGGRAEGSLRELLKTSDVKGKGVERVE